MKISQRYALYDYGDKNQEVYGQDEAPQVPIENYAVPTALMSGDIDDLAVPKDVEWLSETLGANLVFN